MKIGILGSGSMGGQLGVIFSKLGHEVTFSYSRSERKPANLAAAGGNAKTGTPREAAEHAELVLLAVHWLDLDDVLAQAGDLPGKVVLSCTMPLDAGNSELVVGHTDSGAESIACRLPSSHIVASFQATSSELLFDVFEARDSSPRPCIVYCGDHAPSKARAAALLAQIAFDHVDAGPLRIARLAEPFGMLATALAYGHEEGPKWVYHFSRLE
ncbi:MULTISPECIES: NAD(P)-binding domain-containing protein [Pseudomonas]|uniref:Transmembrane reductase oxidoreductase n=1 Tax=Pseudomonas fulva TaxID=47880 RepID=A0A0D0KQC4_9PSED|nr:MULTISPECIES: NAD(P)-binding domain-containing protein [Pseudomonas]KIQ00230.1 transmembrane reductase oxidoreductase [Pseudomonas fulva]